MKSRDIRIGGTYAAKVSGRVVPVRITAEHHTRDWHGVNTETGRAVRIVSPQRLRHEIAGDRPAWPPAPRETSFAEIYAAFKAEDGGRILIFEADTGLRPTILVLNEDIAALESVGVSIPAADRIDGTTVAVATIPGDRLDAVPEAVVASGRRAAVLRRVVDSENIRSEIRRAVTPGVFPRFERGHGRPVTSEGEAMIYTRDGGYGDIDVDAEPFQLGRRLYEARVIYARIEKGDTIEPETIRQLVKWYCEPVNHVGPLRYDYRIMRMCAEGKAVFRER